MPGDGGVAQHCILTEEDLSEGSVEAVPWAVASVEVRSAAVLMVGASAAGPTEEGFPGAAPMAVAVDIAEATKLTYAGEERIPHPRTS